VLTGLDHLIIAAADPDQAASQIEKELGLRASGGGRHEQHGTFNRLIWLGDSYVELMGVSNASLAEGSWWGTHVAGVLTRQSAAVAGLALASDDLAGDVQRLRGQGSRISDRIDGRRLRPDGAEVRWRIARVPDPVTDIGLTFLIEHESGAAEWTPAERGARAVEPHPVGTVARLTRICFPVADVRVTTLGLLRDLGLQFRPSLAGRGARDAAVGTQTLRVTAAASGGVPEIGISAGHRRFEAELLGCRWVVEPL
jgi:hypothetical protein